jgi:hypothetical protein
MRLPERPAVGEFKAPFALLLRAGKGALFVAEEFALHQVVRQGGAIDAASIYAANGLIIANSGYGSFGQAPGNVILGFRPGN